MSNRMTHLLRERKLRFAAFGLVAGLALFGYIAARADAQAPAAWQSVARDAGRFEEDLDEMLLDSPNWLVSGGENARAVYLDGVGLVVSFQASLVGSRWTSGSSNWSWSGFRVKRHGDGWSIYDDEDDWDDEDDDDRDRNRKERDRARAERDRADNDDDEDDDDRDRRSSRERRNFERGKEEMLDFLVDFGPDLSGLRAGESVVLIGCLDGSRFLRREKVGRVIARVSVDDLKARGDGRMNEDALRAKIVMEQY